MFFDYLGSHIGEFTFSILVMLFIFFRFKDKNISDDQKYEGEFEKWE